MRSRPWKKYYGDVPSNISYPDVGIYGLISDAAERFPDNFAYGFMGSMVTFGKMMEEIDALSEALALHGVVKGDTVIVCLPNCPQAIWSVYAVNRCGAISKMICTLSSKNEIRESAIRSDCKLAIVVDSMLPDFIEASEGTGLNQIVHTTLGDSSRFKERFVTKCRDDLKTEAQSSKTVDMFDFMRNCEGTVPDMPEMSGDDAALILSTGGTSGKIKEVVITNLNANASAIQAWMMIDCMEEGDCRTLTVIPLFHGFGLIGNMHAVLAHGGYCEMVPRFDPSAYVELISMVKPNVIMGVPTLYQHLLNANALNGADLSFIKTVIAGGDVLTMGLRKRIEEAFAKHGCRTTVRDGYGLTECVMLTCMTPKDNYKEGFIGIPCPDTFFKVVTTDTENEKPAGEVGQICISGPTVMRIHGCDGETDDSLRVHSDGMVWLHTSDLGLMDAEGYVAYRGRMDRMVISSGYNVYPNQVEDILDSHSAVDSSCVIGIPDDIKTHIVRAFVVLNKNAEKTDQLIKDIQRYCQDNLPRYSVPRDITIVGSMPRTRIGKISYRDIEENIIG